MDDVLIVDDDPAIIEMVSEALSLEDIPHRTAVNGEAALRSIEQGRPAVILLDMNMPVMDGPRFCTELDARHGRTGIAIVVMTAAREVQHFCMQCSATDILGKPFDLDDLYAVIERHRPAAPQG
jgi:CheY-like chemotaxis protein